MPRTARFRIDAMAQLWTELSYAPADTRSRQMDAVESLVIDLDPDSSYPLDYVVFRITGYRPDVRLESPVLVGEALLADLVTMIQLFSQDLDLDANDRGGALRPTELAREWNVSTRTLHRYRQRGLMFHVVRYGDGRSALACYREEAERFRRSHSSQIEEASEYTRIEPRTEEIIVARARDLRQREPYTLNQAATILAKEFGRSRETIRALIHRHLSVADEFRERGPLSAREQRFAYRAWRLGCSLGSLADRLGRGQAALHRIVALERARAIRELSIRWIELPTFELDESGEVILAPEAVACPQPAWPVANDAITLLQMTKPSRSARGTKISPAMIAAYNFLKRRAVRALDGLGARPTSSILDRIETDLRWAALLKSSMVWLLVPAILQRAEIALNRPLEELRPELIRMILRACFGSAASAIELHDPTRSYAIDRWWKPTLDETLAPLVASGLDRLAAAKNPVGSVWTADPFDRVCPWQEMLGPSNQWRNRLGILKEPDRALLSQRFGWAGKAPQTIDSLAAGLTMPVASVTRRISSLIAAIRRA